MQQHYPTGTQVQIPWHPNNIRWEVHTKGQEWNKSSQRNLPDEISPPNPKISLNVRKRILQCYIEHDFSKDAKHGPSVNRYKTIFLEAVEM